MKMQRKKKYFTVYDNREKDSIHQNVYFFIWSKTSVSHLPQLNNNNNKQAFQKRTVNDELSQKRPWRRRTRPNAYTSTFSVMPKTVK